MIRLILFNIFFCAVGLVGCFLLQIHGELSPIISSCLMALVSGLLIENDYFSVDHAKAAIYSGSFSAIGISGIELPIVYLLVLIPIIQGPIFSIFDNYLIGYGGKLGAISFLGVGIIFLSRFLWNI